MDSPDIDPRPSLVTSRRDLDAPKRGQDDPNPKTRMLGVRPIIVFGLDPGKRENRSLATPRICIYEVGAKDDKYEQANKRSDKSHEEVIM